MLNPSEKAQYKTKLTKFNQRYQEDKIKYKKQESRFNQEKDQNALRIKQKENSKEGFDDRLREGLLKGTDDLNHMDNKLIDIERQGEDTN